MTRDLKTIEETGPRLIAAYALFVTPTPIILIVVMLAAECGGVSFVVGTVAELFGLFALCLACGPTAMRRINAEDCADSAPSTE